MPLLRKADTEGRKMFGGKKGETSHRGRGKPLKRPAGTEGVI